MFQKPEGKGKGVYGVCVGVSTALCTCSIRQSQVENMSCAHRDKVVESFPLPE